MTTATRDYENFDTKLYLQINYDKPEKDAYVLRRLAEFFFEVSKENYLNKMLEFGSGPVVSRLITASKYVNNIITAEYVDENRQAIQDWINRDPEAFNWKPTFEYVLQKLEGFSVDEVLQREEILREKIRAVLPCDLKASKPLEILKNISCKYGPPFDIVLVCFCIEVVVESEKEYKDGVSFLASLLRSGGYLVMFGVMSENCYHVGSQSYSSFPVSKMLLMDSFENASLSIVNYDVVSSHLANEEFGNVRPNDEIQSGLKDIYFICGQK